MNPFLFEDLYCALRRMEGRVYPDEVVAGLPGLPRSHPHFREWKIRKESGKRLARYLARRPALQRVLEMGCGNGWLSGQIALIPNREVLGLDVNPVEIQQAIRVFGHLPQLRFILGETGSPGIGKERFDCIVFAASLQYFPSPRDIISWSFRHLRPGGEIHILDTRFYPEEKVFEAKKRTAGYFNSLGFPEMTDFYFHHSFEDLAPFPFSTLYRPSPVNRNLFGRLNPFPWICIRKS